MQAAKSIRFVLIFMLFSSWGANLVAQEGNIFDIPNRASQYYLGNKDEILIQVNIWGFVKKPGQYLVPRHTDLISLISFAGGPQEGANLGRVKILREGYSHLENSGQNGNNGSYDKIPILAVDVQRYLNSGKKGLIPTLQGGDTVLIPQSFGNKFSKFLGVTSVVGLLAATATLILAIDRL